MKLFSQLTVVAAVFAAAAPQATLAQEVTLALPATSLLFSPVYVADERGFWKSRGLDVKMQLIAGPGAINALIAGSAQITSASPVSIYLAAARGQKLQAIASTAERITTEVVLRADVAKRLNVPANADVATRAKALKGVSLAVDSINGFSHGVLRYVMAESGMNPEKDLTVAPMQPSSMTPAMQSHRVDGIVFSQPWTGLAQKQLGGVRWISGPAGDLPKMTPFAANVFMVRHGWCEQNQAICEKFVAGLKDALSFIHEQPSAAQTIVHKRAGAQLDADVMEQAWNSIRPTMSRTPKVDAVAMKNVEDFSVAAGLMKETERVTDWNAIIDNKYAK